MRIKRENDRRPVNGIGARSQAGDQRRMAGVNAVEVPDGHGATAQVGRKTVELFEKLQRLNLPIPSRPPADSQSSRVRSGTFGQVRLRPNRLLGHEYEPPIERLAKPLTTAR